MQADPLGRTRSALGMLSVVVGTASGLAGVVTSLLDNWRGAAYAGVFLVFSGAIWLVIQWGRPIRGSAFSAALVIVVGAGVAGYAFANVVNSDDLSQADDSVPPGATPSASSTPPLSGETTTPPDQSTPSATGTATRTSGVNEPASLIDLEPVTDDFSEPWEIGEVKVGGQAYSRGLSYFCNAEQLQEYILDDDYDRLVAVAGYPEDEPEPDAQRLKILIDGKTVQVVPLTYPEEVQIDVPIAGGHRLGLSAENSCEPFSLGDPRLIPSS